MLLLVSTTGIALCATAAPAVGNLRCEDRVNPLGIDTASPAFSWVLDPEKISGQTAYQVLVASTPGHLSEGKADLWDSGKVVSSRTFGVAYAGKALTSEMQAAWKVRVWDSKGRASQWSAPAGFRMGMLRVEDWGARWIGNREARIRSVPNGYHAAETRADAPKWVQVDLGKSSRIDKIVLFPAKPNNWNPPTSGFGFPPVGKVELATEASFANPVLVARWENGSTLLHGDAPVEFDARRFEGRFVRVTSERLWRRQDGSLCFSLGELEVIADGKNIALGAAVSALDSVENTGGWAMKGLTDGKAAGKLHDPDEFAAVLLRKKFALDRRPARATLSVCGLGYCIPEVNGARVSNAELDPGFTAFHKRALYVTHDVTDRVRKGENELHLTLGGGWYDLGTPELFGFEKAPWTAPPRALVRLKLEFPDGTSQTVVSDETWEAGTGPIQFNCVRGGETLDLTRPVKWGPALVVTAPAGKLQAQAHPPIGRFSEIPAVALTEPQPGIYQFKLAENTAGWPKIRVRGEAGRKITVRCAEDFEPNGAISRGLNSHTYGRYQTDEFVLPDNAEHTLEPSFTYHGFQHVRVEGFPAKPALSDVSAVRVHTLPEPAGSFECSDSLLNRIHELCVRTYLNNLHGIPTDCPQREKAGWMLDGYVGDCIGMWNFRSQNMYTKWSRDMGDVQAADGSVPSIVPNPGWWGLLDPWWGGAAVFVPWDIYMQYGDDRILREQLPVMQKFTDYVTSRAKGNLVDYSLGDWLEVGANGPANRTPLEITSSLGYFNCAQIVSRTAALLGQSETADRYANLANAIRSALNKKYFDAARHRYAPDSQSASAMALALGAVPDGEREVVFKELVRNIVEDRKGHVSTGIVGTRFLFEALHAGGRDDVAYTMLTQPDFPGWVHMMNKGATTAWESWDGGASRNHPALAVVDAWLYQAIGGISPDPGTVAFERITIAPQPLGNLKWARTTHNCVRGKIESNWKLAGDKFLLEIIVPVGTKAKVVLPSRNGPQSREAGPGRHNFKSDL